MLRDTTRQSAVPRPAETVDLSAIRLILFDLDGTLVDSVGDLACAGNAMLRELGLPERSREEVLHWVGNGVERLVKRLLTGDMQAEPDVALLRKGLDRYNFHYGESLGRHSDVFPGVRAALKRLAGGGFRIGCVTNKPEGFSWRLLELVDLDEYFELVVGGDTTPRQKPDPMPLLFAAERFELDAAECMMVGDSRTDVAAARAAGFVAAAVPYGYNHGLDIESSNPDLVIENLRDLADLLTNGAT